MRVLKDMKLMKKVDLKTSRRPLFMAFMIFTAFMAFMASAFGARQNQQGQAPVFKTKVEVVQLDVSVLDKHRQPVRGLMQSDFTILEDGKPRPVVGFSAFDIGDELTPAVGWMRDVPPDVETNQKKESRLVVLVMDDAMIPQDPWMIQASKKIAASIIDKLDRDDLTAVVFTGDNRKTQDFTNDRTKLTAALDKFNPGLTNYRFGADSGGVDVDLWFYLSSVRTLSEASEFLIRAPGQRKVLFWVSPGIPVDLVKAAQSLTSPYYDVFRKTDEMFRRAQRANVTIYPIDPSGLGGMKAYLDLRSPDAGAKVTAMQDYLAATAANTGGRTVMNINDFEQGIRDVFDENKSYYLLAFEPMSSAADGKLHRVDVKVDRDDVEVRTRSGYYAPEPEKPSKDKATTTPENAELTKAIAGLLPDSRLPMRVSLLPFAVPGQRLSTVAIVLGIRQPVPAAAANARVTETTELLTTAFTPEGDPRGAPQRQTASVVLRAGADGEAAYEVLGRIDLPPGRYRLRLAAHNATSAKSGSVFADVIVPDYSNVPFSASPAALSATPGRVSAPKGLLASVLPVVPTAEREFAKADKVEAFMRLYQSGQKSIDRADVAIQIRDSRDQIVASEQRAVGVGSFVIARDQAATQTSTLPNEVPNLRTVPPAGDRFANLALRTADVRYQIPVSTLTTGEYLLTFEATLGTTTIRRDVRFSIR